LIKLQIEFIGRFFINTLQIYKMFFTCASFFKKLF
jgi:hypothetical protein